MKQLTYAISIAASPEHVWDKMLDPETYADWAKAFSANSRYEGEWKEGAHIVFVDPNLGGTKAVIQDLSRPSRIHARHVSTISKDGVEDVASDAAKAWIGTTETYELKQMEDGKTLLRVTMSTHQDFAQMFDDSWPGALELLKAICEAQ